MIEGYWWSRYEPQYLMPICHDIPWEGQEDFLHALRRRQKAAAKVQYRGWSTCRICKCTNGSTEYKSGGWIWPEGYIHYIEEHNVKPSSEFYKFVMASPKPKG